MSKDIHRHVFAEALGPAVGLSVACMLHAHFSTSFALSKLSEIFQQSISINSVWKCLLPQRFS